MLIMNLTTRPDVCNNWDYERNGNLKPENFNTRSKKSVHWKCINDEHHKWIGLITNRCRSTNGNGCPICANQTICECGCNSLEKAYPHIAMEWDYTKNKLTPLEITSKTKEHKYWWICPVDPHHSWTTTVYDRTIGGVNCTICSNNKLCECGCNSLAGKYPEISLEWNERNKLTPNDYSPFSKQKVWWRCKDHPCHEWQTTIYYRTRTNSKCSICTGHQLCPCLCNTVEKAYPQLAKEWDYEQNKVLPSQVLATSHVKIHWICSKDNHHKWSTNVIHRTSYNCGCPICSNKKLCPCEKACNSFATTYPHLLVYWHKCNKTLPTKHFPNSDDKIWWQCQEHEHHKWQNGINNFVGGSNCPYCSCRLLCKCGCNSLLSYPLLLKEWHHEKNTTSPKDHMRTSDQKVWWICKNNSTHEWYATIYSRTSAQETQCVQCFENRSKGELKLIEYLANNSLNYSRNKTLTGCKYNKLLFFDIYVEKYELLIEFDGKQHFMNEGYYFKKVSILKDLIKTNFIIENNLYLLRISYDEIKYISQILHAFINDLNSNNIVPGFYFNYLKKNLNTNILKIYNLHAKLAEENVESIHAQILHIISIE